MSFTFLYVEATNEPVEFNSKENAVIQEQILKVFDIEKWEQKMSEKIESVKLGR